MPVAFHLPATQKKIHGAWITPPCLAALRRKEYLGPKDPQMTWDYWEVQKEETIMLAIVFQWCTIQTRAPSDIFCGAVQELHECQALVVEEGDLFNKEKEIWEGARKLPQQEPPHQKESHFRWPEQRSLPALLYLTLHLHPNQKGWCLHRNWPWCQKGSHHHPQVLSQGPRWPSNATPRRHIPAWSHDLVGPFHTRFTRDDHLPHLRERQSPLLPSGLEPYQDMSLLITSSQGHLEPSSKVKEPWAIIRLCYIMETPVLSIGPSEYPLSQWSEL